MNDLLTHLYNLPNLGNYGAYFRDNTMQLGDKCWVCNRRFSNNLLREDHHVIPTAFGGRDGPQASLCSDHHSLLHKIADLVVPQRDQDIAVVEGFLLGLTSVEQSRTLYLSTRAAMAERVFKDDPNRGVSVSVSLPNTLLKEAQQAAKVLNLSMTTMMTEALIEYVRRRFPLAEEASLSHTSQGR